MGGLRAGLALLLLAAPGGADVVHLHGGGVVRGVVVEQTRTRIVVEAGPGRVSVPRSRVARIETSQTALETFLQRAATLPHDDLAGLTRLARYAADHDLATQARETWRRVLALDPGHPEANAALGRVRLDGHWLSPDEAHRARGDVRFRGGWVSAAEHEAQVRESLARERAATERREALVRLREAEARAREAEARARAAEARADRSEDPVEGIPYWWVLAGGGPARLAGTGHPHVRPPRTSSSKGARPGARQGMPRIRPWVSPPSPPRGTIDRERPPGPVRVISR